MAEVRRHWRQALDTPGWSWVTGGNPPAWYGQTAVTQDGVAAAQSGAIGNSQTTWMETTVSGPGTLTFWWKVSSETNYDFLRFAVDGVEQACISGEAGWVQASFPVAAGSHALRWTYTKDGNTSRGQDAGWVDQVSFTPTSAPTLAAALDTPGWNWVTGGNSPAWYGQTAVTQDGLAAAQSGAIGDSQATWMETTVSGPGTLTFWWKVSSETNCDFLRFAVDGVEQARISGEAGWVQTIFSVAVGSHALRWTYTKDGNTSRGQDAGWLDQVNFTSTVLAPPTIALTAPADNSAFTAPASINLAANVTANGHAITKVQFYNSTTLLGEDSTAPYVLTWNSVPAGTYNLSAQAVYDSGSTVASTIANVTVTNLPPPTIALTSPANNAAFTAPATISLAADVTPNGHTISKVQFYNGTTLLGEATNAPYGFTWSSVAAGIYSLTAQAVYDSGSTIASTAALVAVTIQVPPAIALTAPANNSAFTAPATIGLAANVTANGHAISKVQFYNGTNLLGEAPTVPYVFTWNSVAAGTYSLSAQAVYDSGSIVASTAANVMVTNLPPPTIALTSPANNAAFTAPATISLTANVTANGRSISKVQFYNGATLLGEGAIVPYVFTWNSVAAGTYSLSAQAVYDSGSIVASTAANVTVTNLPPPTIALTSPANNSAFTAPATISLAANVAANGHAIAKVQFYNGATLLGEDTTAPYSLTWSSVAAGNYNFTAQAVYDSGSIVASTTANVTVTNLPPPTIALDLTG